MPYKNVTKKLVYCNINILHIALSRTKQKAQGKMKATNTYLLGS